jgi:hypothetical protein
MGEVWIEVKLRLVEVLRFIGAQFDNRKYVDSIKFYLLYF